MCPLSLISAFQMLKFMHIQSTYYHQGYDLTTDLDSFLKKTGKEVRAFVYNYQLVVFP